LTPSVVLLVPGHANFP